MKRLIIAVCIVGFILTLGAFSSYRIYAFRQEALPLLEQMQQEAQSGRLSAAAYTSQEFYELWEQTKRSLVQFVRRDPVDHISRQAIQLSVFAEYGDLAQFAALTRELRGAVDQLWEDELPYLQNIL